MLFDCRDFNSFFMQITDIADKNIINIIQLNIFFKSPILRSNIRIDGKNAVKKYAILKRNFVPNNMTHPHSDDFINKKAIHTNTCCVYCFISTI